MDLSFKETGDGGDITLEGNDFVTTNVIFNQPYFAMFGGNIEESTGEVSDENQLRFDWWGNDLFYTGQPELQLNSTLEKSLNEVALTSSGRAFLEATVKEDLSYLSEIADVSVSVTIEALDRIRIFVILQQPDNLQSQTFIFLWDGTKLEEIEQQEI